MTNYEHYKEQIDKCFTLGKLFSLNIDGTVEPCKMHCEGCQFEKAGDNCEKAAMLWLLENFSGAEVNWSEVPIDTKVLVRNYIGQPWERAHLAKVEGNHFYTWANGATSWTLGSSVCSDAISMVTCHWNFAKLAEENKND